MPTRPDFGEFLGEDRLQHAVVWDPNPVERFRRQRERWLQWLQKNDKDASDMFGHLVTLGCEEDRLVFYLYPLKFYEEAALLSKDEFRRIMKRLIQTINDLTVLRNSVIGLAARDITEWSIAGPWDQLRDDLVELLEHVSSFEGHLRVTEWKVAEPADAQDSTTVQSEATRQTSSRTPSPGNIFDAWNTPSNWERLERGMSEPEVVAILGQPTSREESLLGFVMLSYRGNVPGSGFVSGNIELSVGRGNALLTDAKAAIVRHVTQQTNSPHHKEVAVLIEAALETAVYTPTAHKQWAYRAEQDHLLEQETEHERQWLELKKLMDQRKPADPEG